LKQNNAKRSHKNNVFVSQKQAKMKQNKFCLTSFRLEMKIKKEQKRDTLVQPFAKHPPRKVE
jgi:hypothetical protein